MSTLIVASVIGVVFIAIIINEVKKRKRGGGCSCGCSGCSMSGVCHQNKKK